MTTQAILDLDLANENAAMPVRCVSNDDVLKMMMRCKDAMRCTVERCDEMCCAKMRRAVQRCDDTCCAKMRCGAVMCKDVMLCVVVCFSRW